MTEVFMDEVILNKVATIEKCLKRVNEEAGKEWKSNCTYQDALILNLERVCQACIDLVAHIVSKEKLGIPKFSREVFDLLSENQIVPDVLAEKLKKMVGFGNLAVHDYGNLNLSVVESIIRNDLEVFSSFTKRVLSRK